jgi:hypothetical protein
MKKLNCKIHIGPYAFHYVVDFTIKSDIENLTQTCEILLPRKLEWKHKQIALGEGSLLKTGYKVTVKAAYDKALETIFKGYLTRIKPGVRVGLVCEDEMYSLKSTNITKSYKKVNLKTLLTDIIPKGIEVKAQNVELGHLRLTNVSIAQVLAYLKKEYGLYSYFKNEKLLVGLAYWPDEATKHIFHFQRNIPVSGHPEYIKANDVKLKVKAISVMPDNTKIEANLGDKTGEQRTLYFYDIQAKDLETLAKQKLETLRYNGFRGDFTAFGEPLAKRADIAVLQDDIIPDRNGEYLIKSVTIKFGLKGFRQTIKLGNKI